MTERPVAVMVIGTPPNTSIHVTQQDEHLWLTPTQATELAASLTDLATKVAKANEALS